MVDEIQDIKILNIDDVQYPVDSLSEGCQRLVQIYNKWNRREAEIRDEMMLIQAAKESMSRQIITQVRNEMMTKESVDQVDQENTQPGSDAAVNDEVE